MNTKKRIIAAVTAAAIAVSSVSVLVSLSACAETIYLENAAVCEIDTSGLTDATGNYSYGIDSTSRVAVISRYNGTDTVVSIPAELDGYPVIGIANGAFSDNAAITRVVVPSGIEFIGTYSNYSNQDYEYNSGAFQDCTSLTSITLPDTVWHIGRSAFANTGLRSVSIPDGASFIGPNAFSGCSSLASVKLPEGLTSIAPNCFCDCTALRSIKLPSTVDSIYGRAFSGCTNLASVVFPEAMTMSAISGLSDSSDYTGYQFAGCTSLTNVTLPDSMLYIPACMFKDSGLKNIHIGDNTAKIEHDAFYGCTFNDLYIPDGAVITRSVETDMIILNKCTVTNKLSVPSELTALNVDSDPFEREVRGCFTIKRIEETVSSSTSDSSDESNTSIEVHYEVTVADGKSTFDISEFHNLIYETPFTVILPDTVTRITNSSVDSVVSSMHLYELTLGGGVISIDEGALDGLRYLESIYVSKAGRYSSYDGILFSDDGTTLVKYPYYYGGGSIDEFHVPYGTKKIADGAFKQIEYYTSAYPGAVYIPETVTYIGASNDGLGSTIYGKAGSEAERFANEHGCIFIDTGSSTEEEKYTYTENVVSSQTITRENTNFTQPTFSGDYGDVIGTLVYTDEYGSVMTYEGVRAMLANFRSGTYTIGYRFTPDSSSVYGGEKTGTITLDMTRIPVAAPVVSVSSSNGQILLSWAAVNEAIAYEIDLVDGDDIVKVGDTTQTSYAYTNVAESESYSFVVRAYDGDTFSDYTEDDIVTAIVKSDEPSDPFADVTLEGHSLVITDNIGVNFYMTLSDEIIADPDACMEFSLPNGTVSRVMVSDARTQQLDGKTCYVFPCYVAACEMTDRITARLASHGEYGTEYTYSVQEYAKCILDEPELYADTIPVIKAMLNYGSEAQVFFAHNTDSLANSILSPDDRVLTDKSEIDLSLYNISVTGNNESLSYKGIVISLKSRIVLKIYFDTDTDMNINSFSVNEGGNAISADRFTIGSDSNGKYLAISDICAGDFDRSFTVSSGDLTVSNISVFSYIAQALDSSDSQLVDVARALYDYNRSVEAYIS